MNHSSLTFWNRPSYLVNRRALWREPLEETSRFFERFFEDLTVDKRRIDFAPLVDVHDNETHFFLNVDIPGVKKEDVKVELKENTLTITGERKTQKTIEEKVFSERIFGRFERRFQVPPGIKQDAIAAHFENGVLEITIPKAEPDKPKEIEIKEGKTLN